jgi:hypothetical protein
MVTHIGSAIVSSRRLAARTVSRISGVHPVFINPRQR